MKELQSITQTIAELPPGSLGIFVILAAFGLAAYAIYAVLSVTRGRK